MIKHSKPRPRIRATRRGYTWYVIDAFGVVYAQARHPLPRSADAYAAAAQAAAKIQTQPV